MEELQKEVMTDNPQALKNAKYLEVVSGEKSYSFLRNYQESNIHIRRIQASAILEKIRNLQNEKTRSGQQLDERSQRIMRAMLTLDLISKTCMLIDDLVIFAKEIKQPKKIEMKVSKRIHDGVIEKYLANFNKKTDDEIRDIFSLPGVDKEKLTTKEKTNLKEIYNANFETIRKNFEQLNKYRDMYKIAYLKAKHGLPIITTTGESGESDIIAIFETTQNKEGEKMKIHAIVINKQIAESSFSLLCRVTELFNDILLGKIHELECGGFKTLGLGMYGLNKTQLEEFEKIKNKHESITKPHRINIKTSFKFIVKNSAVKKQLDFFGIKN